MDFVRLITSNYYLVFKSAPFAAFVFSVLTSDFLLSYHGDGDPHSEAESEVLSVRDAAFAHRQAVTRGET